MPSDPLRPHATAPRRPCVTILPWLLSLLSLTLAPAGADTFTVTTLAASGADSLRQAICWDCLPSRGGWRSMFGLYDAADGLSEEQLAVVDNAPDEFTPDSEIILPNGWSLDQYLHDRGIELEDFLPFDLPSELAVRSATIARSSLAVSGPEQRKNDFIAKMLLFAKYFACGRDSPPCSSWKKDADPVDPVRRPAQQGLTYVFGGKDPTIREAGIGCQEETHGMDCSGMVYQLAMVAGATDLIKGNANRQQDPSKWHFPEDWHLKMERVTDGSDEAGDIVGFSGHIGISDGQGKLISSAGGATPMGGNCMRNITPPRGPRSLRFHNFGPITTRLRLVACGGAIKVGDEIRYQPIGDDCGIVRDVVTGLEWQRCSVGQTWIPSEKRCDGGGNFYNWNNALLLTAEGGFRLPSINELRTLVYCSSGVPVLIGMDYDYIQCQGMYQQPTIVEGAFPDASMSSWSSSPNANHSASAWFVDFYSGYVFPYGRRGNVTHVRLVRAGQ